MKFVFRTLLACSVLLLAHGCAKQTMMTKMPTEPGHVFVKNYELNEQLTINVGESVVRVKDYDIIIRHAEELTPDKDFTIGAWTGDVYLAGTAGTPITVAGTVQDKGERYHLLQSSLYQLLIPIKADGTYQGGSAARSMGAGGSNIAFSATGTLSLKPADTIFTPSKSEKVDSSAGYVNYEIVYTGMTADAINLLYREYTPNDMARPAFYQNLTYPIGTETIRFKKLKIKIYNIDQGSMAYTVLEDGTK